MQFKSLLLLVLSLITIPAFSMELTQENSGGVADQVEELTPEQVKKNLCLNNDPKLLEYILSFKLYPELDQKISKANNYTELTKVQKEIIALVTHYKHVGVPFDISDLKRKLDSKKAGDLNKLQQLYNDFNNALHPWRRYYNFCPRKNIDIVNAQGQQIEERKRDMLWRTILAFENYFKENEFCHLVTQPAQKLFDALIPVIDLNNAYNSQGELPLIFLAGKNRWRDYKNLKLLTSHGANVFKPDRNGKTAFEAARQAYENVSWEYWCPIIYLSDLEWLMLRHIRNQIKSHSQESTKGWVDLLPSTN